MAGIRTWTDAEDRRLFALKEQGAATADIAEELGRTAPQVRDRFSRLRARNRARSVCAELAQPRDADRSRIGRPPESDESSRQKALAAAAERRAAELAQPRSITSEFFGDPPPGRSALDQLGGRTPA